MHYFAFNLDFTPHKKVYTCTSCGAYDRYVDQTMCLPLCESIWLMARECIHWNVFWSYFWIVILYPRVMCSAVPLVVPTAPQIYGHKLNQSVPLTHHHPLPTFAQLPSSFLHKLSSGHVKNSWIDLAAMWFWIDDCKLTRSSRRSVRDWPTTPVTRTLQDIHSLIYWFGERFPGFESGRNPKSRLIIHNSSILWNIPVD